MLALRKYQKKKVAIYGMGATGQTTAKVLKRSGAQIFCWDDDGKIRKKVRKKDLSKFWIKESFIDNIVISPGIDINKCKIRKYLKKNYKKIITDLDLFFELNNKVLIISVTGTNGKSTTCKIIEKILKTAKYKNVSTLGNIGKPILSLHAVRKKHIFILEVSSYQLQYSKVFRSKYAAILNISADHLERHKNIKNYIKTKSKIFFAQNKSDFSYINEKNKYSKYIKKIFKLHKLKSKLVHVNKSNCNFLLKKIKNKHFKSQGNIENLAFACKIAKNLKIKDRFIIKALNSFKGLQHRQEIVFYDKNIQCINDSKATSFDASFQSLLNNDKIYWIVGGTPKKKDYFNLRKIKNKIIKAYIVGKNISFFKKQIGKSVPYEVSGNIKIALQNIYRDMKLKKGHKNTILLSPAAASFDQFNNFEERGSYFKSLILKKFRKN
jgi:UDP-N-acetylmuramoylalanine--D-glutamate ligase